MAPPAGKYAEASQLYVQSGHGKKAVEMFLDLRDWELARSVLERLGAQSDGGIAMTELIRRQAQWLVRFHRLFLCPLGHPPADSGTH